MRLRVFCIVSPLLILLLACADDGESPPPPPWSSWARCQLPGDVSVALPPGYIVTHVFDPADTLLYGYLWTSFQRTDISAFANVSDNSTYYTSTLTNPYLLFQAPTGHRGGLTLSKYWNEWRAEGYLQTRERDRYRRFLAITFTSPDRLEEVSMIIQSLQYR